MATYEAGRGPHYAQVPHDLLTDDRTDSHHIAVYAALRSYCDFGSSEGAHPSDTAASERAGCARRTFIDRRQDLASWGWIDVRSGRENGATNRYVIHGSVEGCASDAQGCAGDAQGGVQEMHTTNSHTTESHYQEGDAEDEIPVSEMWSVWVDVVWNGSTSRRLTDKREGHLRQLWREHLTDADDPERLLRDMLRAMTDDEWWGERPDTWVPETAFKNAERRERWAVAAENGAPRGGRNDPTSFTGSPKGVV